MFMICTLLKNLTVHFQWGWSGLFSGDLILQASLPTTDGLFQVKLKQYGISGNLLV
jgi:hypothetical protein